MLKVKGSFLSTNRTSEEVLREMNTRGNVDGLTLNSEIRRELKEKNS